MTAASSPLLCEITDDVAVLTLNRPQALNAIDEQLALDLRRALTDLTRGRLSARALVLTGAGRGFCAGADLASGINPNDSATLEDLGMVLERHYNPIIKLLRALPMPIVAAVNGPCAGAGMSLAIASDIVIAGQSASFLQAFVNIGLVPDAGSSYFLPRLAGRGRAARMMLLGEKLTAADALEWGVVSSVVDDDKLMDEAMKVARKLAQGPTKAINLIRHMLDQSEINGLSDQLDLERTLQAEAGRYDDFKEGVAAFMEKRKANFKGQ